MGTKNSKIFNEECPICLEEEGCLYNLQCGHSFHKYCLQKFIYKFIIVISDSNIINCPVCRKTICDSDIKLIFKKWEIINYLPTHWINKNTIDINNNQLKIISYSTITLKNNNIINIPLFNIKKINNIVNIPLFFHSPDLYNIKILNNDPIISNIENSHSEYEDFNNFTLSIIGSIQNMFWNKFVNKNFKQYDTFEIVKDCLNSNQFMRFYIKDFNKIDTIDLQFGTIDNEFILKENRCFKILFKMYILKTLDNICLINEIHQIMYL
jgi:hypothetical protein